MAVAYSYRLERLDTENKRALVVYSSEGQPDYFFGSRCMDFTVAGIDALVKHGASKAREFWEADNPVSEVEEGTTGTVEAIKTVVEDVPAYDPVTDVIEPVEVFDPATSTKTVTYSVTPADEATLSARRSELADGNGRSNASLRDNIAVLTQKLVDVNALSDEEVALLFPSYPIWSTGVSYSVDDVVSYGDTLYKCVQAHTSQPAWGPEFVPALFTPFRDPSAGPVAWVQPTGAQDAYAIGDRVTHPNANDGNTVYIYESKIDANTTEPGTDGTFDRWWEPVAPV